MQAIYILSGFKITGNILFQWVLQTNQVTLKPGFWHDRKETEQELPRTSKHNPREGGYCVDVDFSFLIKTNLLVLFSMFVQAYSPAMENSRYHTSRQEFKSCSILGWLTADSHLIPPTSVSPSKRRANLVCSAWFKGFATKTKGGSVHANNRERVPVDTMIIPRMQCESLDTSLNSSETLPFHMESGLWGQK